MFWFLGESDLGVQEQGSAVNSPPTQEVPATKGYRNRSIAKLYYNDATDTRTSTKCAI